MLERTSPAALQCGCGHGTRASAFQVLPNLVHHLLGSGIFVDSVVVGQAFVSQAKRTLGGPADHREIFRTFVRVVHRTLRVLLLDSGLGPTVGFPPIA